MKRFEKGLSPLKSNANPNLPSSDSVENNENYSSGDKLIPQLANHKKHFMSGVPRKKILAEIKEIPSASDAQVHNNSNLGFEKSPPKKGVSEPRDDLSVKVYDPLTNYLSPRPQYLRFNPNRRREILKRLEKELNSSLDSEEANDEEEWSVEEIADSFCSPPKGSAVNQGNGGVSEDDNGNVVDCYEVEEIEEIADSCVSPAKGSAVNQRNGGISEEGDGNVVDVYEVEEEEEEEVEKRGWCLRGILKLLVTLIGCLLLASYISYINSPTDSTTQQAIWGFKDSGVLIKNQTLEFVSTKLHGDGFFEVEDGGSNSIEEVGVDDENNEEFDESIEAEIVEYLEWLEKEMVENENEDSEDAVDEAAEFEGVRAAQFEFKADEFEHLIDAKTEENSDGGILLDMEGLYEDNVNKDEAEETEIIGGGVVDSEAQSSGQFIGAKAVESEDAGGYMLEMETHSSNQLQEDIPTESKGADDTGSLEELVGSQEESSDSMDEVDEIGDDTEVGMEKSEWNTSTVIGVSALLIVSTSLAIIYNSRKSRRSTSSKESEPVLKQKLAVEENVNTVLPPIDRKVEFLARASLPSSSVREAPRDVANHIHAPTVELISEIVVGQPSRFRNSGKFQMIISEDECNAATLSQKRGSPPQLVPALSQPSAIEPHPSTSSTSIGNSTTERNISKKEGSQSRETMNGTTPVRRSSRLRNRSAVMSP